MEINYQRIYPTTSLESITNDSVLYFIEKIKDGEQIVPISVVEFENNYYIVDGHHRYLAMVISRINNIHVNVLLEDELPTWYNRESFLNNLKAIGMRAVYDFEAVGDYSYDNYPEYYKG